MESLTQSEKKTMETEVPLQQGTFVFILVLFPCTEQDNWYKMEQEVTL